VPEKTFDWQLLGSVDPQALADARLQCHYAAQIVSSAGVTCLPAETDDSHTNMGWCGDLSGLAGRVVSPGKPLQAALRFADLTLLFLNGTGAVKLEYSLSGRTLDEGYDWLQSAIESHLGHAPARALVRSAYEMPSHPVASGAAFSASAHERYRELARWYGNAAALLELVRADIQAASEVRCWPHHFDIATLIELDHGSNVEKPQTVGIGLSPGDGSYDEPYFYVTPYPYPDAPEPMALGGGGMWHTEGWFGAVLTASTLVAGRSAADQRRHASAFVESAVSACRKLLGVVS